jgi:hypothetical protein
VDAEVEVPMNLDRYFAHSIWIRQVHAVVALCLNFLSCREIVLCRCEVIDIGYELHAAFWVAFLLVYQSVIVKIASGELIM